MHCTCVICSFATNILIMYHCTSYCPKQSVYKQVTIPSFRLQVEQITIRPTALTRVKGIVTYVKITFFFVLLPLTYFKLLNITNCNN